MARNTSGMTIHVHVGGQTVLVGPGEDFPEDVEVDPALTGGRVAAPDSDSGSDSGSDSDSDSDRGDEAPVPAPAPAATITPRSTVPEIREALEAAGVEFTEHDRKDALLAKAESADLFAEGS